MPANPSTARGRAAVKEAIGLQQAACIEGERIIQLCVIDHSSTSFASPHIHLSALFNNNARSSWVSIEGATLADLREVMPAGVRTHLHADEPKNPPAAAAFIKSLPHVKLSPAAVRVLALGGGDDPVCNICLEEYAAGATLAVMPCAGLHKFHVPCITSWLKNASTCPCCQWGVPASPSASELVKLLAPARTECARLAAAQLPPCQLADDESSPSPRRSPRTSPRRASVGSRAFGFLPSRPFLRRAARPARSSNR